MRRFHQLILLLWGIGVTGAHATNMQTLDTPFFKAQQAYDAGRYAEATTAYQTMLSNGCTNIEIHYNLANAFFRLNDLPNAVKHYRLAYYQAPRDPDIEANLGFALRAAGAVPPTMTTWENYSRQLAARQWKYLGIGAWWGFALLVAVGLLSRPPAKGILLRMTFLPAGLLLLAILGWWPWNQLAQKPEAVIVRDHATALYGPVEGSTAHYSVPPGALVKQIQHDARGWVEITYDGKNGWLRDEYIQRISP